MEKRPSTGINTGVKKKTKHSLFKLGPEVKQLRKRKEVHALLSKLGLKPRHLRVLENIAKETGTSLVFVIQTIGESSKLYGLDKIKRHLSYLETAEKSAHHRLGMIDTYKHRRHVLTQVQEMTKNPESKKRMQEIFAKLKGKHDVVNPRRNTYRPIMPIMLNVLPRGVIKLPRRITDILKQLPKGSKHTTHLKKAA